MDGSTRTPEPEFNGQCAFAVSTGKYGVAGDTRHRVAKDGKVYLFSNPAAKLFWRVLPGRRRKSEAAWSARTDSRG